MKRMCLLRSCSNTCSRPPTDENSHPNEKLMIHSSAADALREGVVVLVVVLLVVVVVEVVVLVVATAVLVVDVSAVLLSEG